MPAAGSTGWCPQHVLATEIFDNLTLGHFYSILTWLLGFEPVGDEGKVEALSAHTSPDNEFLEALHKTIFLDAATARLVVSSEDAYALYFDIPRLKDFVRRLGPEALAAAAQRFLEDRALELVQLLLTEFPRASIVLSGGCAANVILNMHIYERLCPNIYVVPAMADEGTALGTAVLALKQS